MNEIVFGVHHYSSNFDDLRVEIFTGNLHRLAFFDVALL